MYATSVQARPLSESGRTTLPTGTKLPLSSTRRIGPSPVGFGHSNRTRLALLTAKLHPVKPNRPKGVGASGLVRSTTSPSLAYATPPLYTRPVWKLPTSPAYDSSVAP